MENFQDNFDKNATVHAAIYYPELEPARLVLADRPGSEPGLKPMPADGGGADGGLKALPAIDWYDSSGGDSDASRGAAKGRDKQTPERDKASGAERTSMQWPDSGQYSRDARRNVTKTVSADGTKTREWERGNPNNPDEITKIIIDHNRVYEKGEGDNWHYTVDGQPQGIWHGSVNLTKEGVYSYTATADGVTHNFGSGKSELLYLPERGRSDDRSREGKSGRGGAPDSLPAPSDEEKPAGRSGVRQASAERREEDERPHSEIFTPPAQDGYGQREAEREKRASEKDDAARESKERAEKEKKKLELKEKYSTAETDAAIEAAARAGLPLMVHVGGPWCGHCNVMEAKVWPTIEKESKGKALFLNLDNNQAANNVGGPRGAAIDAAANGSYPYMVLFRPTIDDSGRLKMNPVRTHSGGMTLDETRRFLSGSN